MNKLEELGYKPFFDRYRLSLEEEGFSLARITAEYKEAYRTKYPEGERLARITGKRMFEASSREDYPAVGDWVAITRLEQEQAVIHSILPRKTVLKRKYSGRFESQVIASNIDTAFIVESVDRDFSLNRFERYLTIVNEGNIRAVMVLNKADTVSERELNSRISQMRKRFKDIEIISTSAVDKDGIDVLTRCVRKGETYCFLGSSGVGKSTLINKLLGNDLVKTAGISGHTGKGTHTTTTREMYFLGSGGILIDNPGMREVGIADSSAGVENVFDEIEELAAGCQFKDCTHMHEPGCAVLEAVEAGELDEDRYSNYLKLSKEAEFYEMTAQDKRRKERDFGKMIKNYRDHQKKNKH
ncbi:MAG: ribosome small subunit-dependent GTPase A [Actinobacteria bacterium]|nr:ribosome small subunit-dependent GTPase A [Actinomycetota bacterium]